MRSIQLEHQATPASLWKDPVARFRDAGQGASNEAGQHPAGAEAVNVDVIQTPKAETILAFVCGATLGGTCKGFWTVGCCTVSSC